MLGATSIWIVPPLPSLARGANQESAERIRRFNKALSSMPNTHVPPFHLAFPVRDVEEARRFYVDVLECEQGRSSDRWVDLNLYGHQIVAHYQPALATKALHHNPVDGHDVPVPHFGVVLPWEAWHHLAERLRKAEMKFIIEPYVRFEGEVGEQATMFFLDPSGNALEFKAFKDPRQLFASS